MVPRGGNAHFLPLQEYDRGAGENRRTNEQTRTMLGVNSEHKESMQHYISVSIYGLMLAWITGENSTKQLECQHLDSIFFAGPYLLCWSHRSGVRCRQPLSVVPRQLLPAPLSNQLSSHVPLPLPATPRFQVQKPFAWFRAKTDKGIVCLAGHLYTVTQQGIT